MIFHINEVQVVPLLCIYRRRNLHRTVLSPGLSFVCNVVPMENYHHPNVQ